MFAAFALATVVLDLVELLNVSWSRKTECGINQFLTPHPLRVVLELAGEAGGIEAESRDLLDGFCGESDVSARAASSSCGTRLSRQVVSASSWTMAASVAVAGLYSSKNLVQTCW